MTYNEVVQRKLKPGKFMFNPTGIIMVLGLIFLLAAVTFYVAQNTDATEAKVYIFSVPNVIVFIVSFILYVLFSTGYVRRKPWRYVKIDIAANIFLPIIGIICIIIAGAPTTNNNSIKDVPLPFGITGNVLLLVSAATMFMFYRYKEENLPPDKPENTTIRVENRPSIQI